jgi:hypothetical protein
MASTNSCKGSRPWLAKLHWQRCCARSRAEQAGLSFDYVAAWITLNVHSALEAVGLTAAFATALGQAGISCNVIAGYYHDHLFVGQADAERAMQVLRDLAANAE